MDNLLVKGEVQSTSFFHQGIPTGNTQRYTQKKVMKVERENAMNCGFLLSPQLQPLVTTNSSIDIQPGVREPRVTSVVRDKLGS